MHWKVSYSKSIRKSGMAAPASYILSCTLTIVFQEIHKRVRRTNCLSYTVYKINNFYTLPHHTNRMLLAQLHYILHLSLVYLAYFLVVLYDLFLGSFQARLVLILPGIRGTMSQTQFPFQAKNCKL